MAEKITNDDMKVKILELLKERPMTKNEMMEEMENWFHSNSMKGDFKSAFGQHFESLKKEELIDCNRKSQKWEVSSSTPVTKNTESNRQKPLSTDKPKQGKKEKDLKKDISLTTSQEEYYESIESDLLERLKTMGSNSEKGTKFEFLCLELLEKMGYGTLVHNGGADDHGVDGFLIKDPLGFEQIGIQCKCEKSNKIGVSEIDKFESGLIKYGLSKGIYLTTNDYTQGIEKTIKKILSRGIKIILINGKKLVKLMREYEVGVEVIKTNYVYNITLSNEE